METGEINEAIEVPDVPAHATARSSDATNPNTGNDHTCIPILTHLNRPAINCGSPNPLSELLQPVFVRQLE